MKSRHYEDVLQYCREIKSGKIASGLYTKKAINRFLDDIKRQKDEDFDFELDTEKADEVIDFAESLIIPDINKKLELLPWMKFVYYNLLGFVYKLDHDKRRFRQGYVEVARKNSKTTSLLFPLILYDFISTNAAESYFVNRDGGQSAKSYKDLLNLIKSNDELQEACECYSSAITLDNSRISFFSSESGGIDGYRNSMSVIDEYHSYADDKVVTAFRYGGRARKNSLVLIITSAGLDISLPCYAENQKTKSILNQTITDETYFGIIYAYDEKDDWKNPKNFIKANPSLNVILDPKILEQDLTDALITPSHQPDFKSKTCGIWTSGNASWLSIQQWQAAQPTKPIDFNQFKDQPSFGALDLSSVGDFSVFTICFSKDGKYYLKHKFYIPEDTLRERYSRENINLLEWTQKGLVTAIPGPTIDYSYIKKDILEASKEYKLLELAYDPWQSSHLIDSLEADLPQLNLITINQNLKSLSPPTKQFEKFVLEKKIVDKSPVMLWMIGNVVVKPDVNDNYKPLKEAKNSTKRIDGVITSIMALDRAVANANTTFVKPTSFKSLLNLFS